MSDQQHSHPTARQDEPPSTPTWVKLLGVGAVLLIIMAVLALISGSGHGPGMHGG